MKKISIYFLLGFSILSFSLKAQWTEINTGISSPKDICFLDSLNGFIVNGNSIYRTIDGGYNWSLLSSDLENQANCVGAYNQDTIIIGNSLLKASYDGGQNWSVLPPPEINNDQNIKEIGVVSDHLYCMISDITSCTWLDYSPTYNSYDLYRSNNWGNMWQSINLSIIEPAKLNTYTNNNGSITGRRIVWHQEHCYHDLGAVYTTISGNNYTSNSHLTEEYFGGCSLPNNITISILNNMSDGTPPYLKIGNVSYPRNEIYNNMTDIVFYNYQRGYLIKDTEVYKTEDAGDHWDIDNNTSASVIKSLLLENGKVVLLCENSQLYISEIDINIPKFDIITLTNTMNFYEVGIGGQKSKQLNIYNTGSKTVTINSNLVEPFYLNPVGTTDTISHLSNVILENNDVLELNIIFQPDNISLFTETLDLTIVENPEFSKSVTLLGNGVEFDGTFYQDSILCADTIFVNKSWEIPADIKVEVCPGTVVVSGPTNRWISVNGSFLANGTNIENIVFHRIGLSIKSGKNNMSKLKNCIFNEGTELYIKSTESLSLDSSMIQGELSIYNTSNTQISNCVIECSYSSVNNKNYSISSSKFTNKGSLRIENSDSVSICNNEIYDIVNCGISIRNSSAMIRDNYIYNNNYDYNYISRSGGISVLNSSAQIVNNFIFNNKSVSKYGGIYIDFESSNVELINNTICSNDSIGIYWDSATGVMHNNIIYNNPVEIIEENITMTHNLFSEQVLGQNNITGNPFFNNPSTTTGIIANPEELDWRILSYSPCLDAGNNEAVVNIPFDFYGNTRIMDGNRDGSAIVDIGAYEMDGELFGLNEVEKKIAQIYPNPSSGQIQIHLNENKTQPLELKIYEISGSLVWEGIISDKQSSINLESLKAGVYLLKLIEEDHSQREILILQ